MPQSAVWVRGGAKAIRAMPKCPLREFQWCFPEIFKVLCWITIFFKDNLPMERLLLFSQFCTETFIDSTIRICLAPCKYVRHYGPLTEPKIYMLHSEICSNTHSNLKRPYLGNEVRYFRSAGAKILKSDRGLSSTLSWMWPSATLSPSFGLSQSEKPLIQGVPGVSWCLFFVRICPRDR